MRLLLFLLCTVIGRDGSYAVVRGSNFRMTCTPKDEPRIEGSVVWTDGEGRETINARFTKLNNGDLEVNNAHVGDSGSYKCKYRSLASPEDLGKVYERKLLVYELAGHKFISSAFFDVSKYSDKDVTSFLKDMLTYSVCSRDLCVPVAVKTTKCEPSDKAEKRLEAELKKVSQDPERRMRADMKTFSSKHLITCRAGFHLVKAHYKRCFPCIPGYYSEANTVECSMCKVGTYQESYGKRECEKCEDDKTTDTMGAKSRDECIPAEDKKGILGGIKDGILSVFSGR